MNGCRRNDDDDDHPEEQEAQVFHTHTRRSAIEWNAGGWQRCQQTLGIGLV